MNEEEKVVEDGRARWKPGTPLAFGRFWWRDWLSEPVIRRLSHEQRGRFMDVRAATYGTATPGEMTEEDVRAWAGYTPEEWRTARVDFRPLFKVTRRGPGGRWFLEDIRRDYAATVEIARRAYERSMKGVAARRRGKDLATTGSTPGAEKDASAQPGVQPQVQPQVDTDVRLQIPELQRTDKSESDSRVTRAQKSRSRAGSAGPAGSSRESRLEPIVARALDGNPPARRGSA